jgi:hypothetical protein
MRNRKLQIFLSSTYSDLTDLRLSAIEAILAAGHIPATMEQFTPGDETALEIIRRWVSESDALVLLLGGRYGSIEPRSGKSYTQLEYELALELRKPYFALVMSDEALEERAKHRGLRAVDERDNQAQYKAFKAQVCQKLCAFFHDAKDVRATIFQKLPEWSQREDLAGWIRGTEAASPQTANEIARLSQENAVLREQLVQRQHASEVPDERLYGGLTFRELSTFLFRKCGASVFRVLDQLAAHKDGSIGPRDIKRMYPDNSNALLETVQSLSIAIVTGGGACVLTEAGHTLMRRVQAKYQAIDHWINQAEQWQHA